MQSVKHSSIITRRKTERRARNSALLSSKLSLIYAEDTCWALEWDTVMTSSPVCQPSPYSKAITRVIPHSGILHSKELNLWIKCGFLVLHVCSTHTKERVPNSFSSHHPYNPNPNWNFLEYSFYFYTSLLLENCLCLFFYIFHVWIREISFFFCSQRTHSSSRIGKKI